MRKGWRGGELCVCYSLWRVEGGAGGGWPHQPELAVQPEAKVLQLTAHAQPVRHRLLLDVEVLKKSQQKHSWAGVICHHLFLLWGGGGGWNTKHRGGGWNTKHKEIKIGIYQIPSWPDNPAFTNSVFGPKAGYICRISDRIGTGTTKKEAINQAAGNLSLSINQWHQFAVLPDNVVILQRLITL